MNSEVNNNYAQRSFKKNKKKKKSKFLQNAKGFAKQGVFGRGTYIEENDHKYFIAVLDLMKNKFQDVEEKVNMSNNVFEQTNGREVHLASNQIVCKVMESLMGFIDAERLERCFEAFADNFRPICSDAFASHVLQKMVEIAFLRSTSNAKLKKTKYQTEAETIKEDDEGEPPLAKKVKVNVDIFSDEMYNSETEFSQEHKRNCENFVLRVGKFMLNNLEDFVWDKYASHIMRTCILCLAGVHIPKVTFQKEKTFNCQDIRKIYEVPSEWHDVCKEYAQRLEMWPQFNDLPYKDCSSALLSVLCVALKAVDKHMFKHFGKKILTEALLETDEDEKMKNNDDTQGHTLKNEEACIANEERYSKLPKVFENNSSIILLETLLSNAGPKLLTQINVKLFMNRLTLLAKRDSTNYSVKKLIDNVKQKEEFENMFEELQDHIEELLKIGHTAVVAALSATCLRLQTKQSKLISSLQSALHVSGDKERLKSLFLCLSKLKPFEISKEDKSSFVHLHGSLIIQHLLCFNKPIFIVNCILETSPDFLVSVLNTPNGSHICDAFLESKFIGEKSRDKFVKHLEGFYVELAITKFGSRIIESLFAASQDAQKMKIVKELAQKINALQSTPFGKIINQKLNVATYRLSADRWSANLEKKESKVQKLFKDLTN